MSDVLSQNEIDDLLAALSTGEVNVKEIEEESSEKKVRKYDFTRPDKFAKDQLRTLEIIHENFSRLMNNFLSGYLRTFVEVEVLSVQSLIYNEFSNSISNPCILGVVDFAPLDGQIIIDVATDMAYTMIERILGGSGNKQAKKEHRSLTEIEITLLKTILIKFINLLKEPWGNIIEIKPKLERIETNSQFAQIVSPSESIALVTLSLKIGESEGMINICIPHVVIEPILASLSSRLWFSTSGKKEISELEKRALEKNISKSKVKLKAVIGKSTITVGELLTLRPGDVVLLDKGIEDALDIYIGEELKYHGKPGIKNKKVAIKITGAVGEGDE